MIFDGDDARKGLISQRIEICQRRLRADLAERGRKTVNEQEILKMSTVSEELD
jgi:hypothetical protein